MRERRVRTWTRRSTKYQGRRDQQPDAVVPPGASVEPVVPDAAPVVTELFRFDVPGGSVVPVGGIWPVPPVGLFADNDPAVPRLALPPPPEPHGKPLMPIRPELLVFSVPLWALEPGLAGLLELVELPVIFGFEVDGLVLLGFIVLWLIALGFDALGLGLPGVIVVLPAVVPGLAPVDAPAALPPAEPPPLAPPL
jgi:hypothetical protein